MSTTTDKKITKPNNVIQVSVRKSIFPYLEMSKRLLDQGEKEVEISGLGASVNTVASVADILSTGNYVKITKILTTRGGVEEARRTNVARLQVFVVKSDKFDGLYAAEKKEREEKKAVRDEAKKTKEADKDVKKEEKK